MQTYIEAIKQRWVERREKAQLKDMSSQTIFKASMSADIHRSDQMETGGGE